MENEIEKSSTEKGSTEKGSTEIGSATGKNMMIIAWIIALALLTYYFRFWEEQQYNPNSIPQQNTTSDGFNEVTLERNRSNHYVTAGFINRVPVTFLLDTGATDVVVPSKLAEKLGLQGIFSATAQTANGPTTVFATLIESIQIGNIHFEKVKASINPNMGDMEVLLGMSALKDVEFIQRGNFLTLRQSLQHD
jgi:aspartyl protease family protein